MQEPFPFEGSSSCSMAHFPVQNCRAVSRTRELVRLKTFGLEQASGLQLGEICETLLDARWIRGWHSVVREFDMRFDPKTNMAGRRDGIPERR